MAIKINFDANNLPENPTFNLGNRSGEKYGLINAKNIVIKDCMNNAPEMSFKIYKYLDGKKDSLWDKIKDFKLVYCREIDLWFEIKVTIDESDKTVKNVSCKQLAQSELSQLMLYKININNEDDIAREDYKKPTILFNEEDTSISLLHRIMDKAKHYKIIHVDSTIAKIQRTFSFDNKSIYDAMQEIAKEIGCIFVFHSGTDENGKIRREISVYDLESNCLECGYRGEFTHKCPECDSTNITEGYGDDTTIFVTADELGKTIHFETDNDKVKNCFKLIGGDDLMTATIRNCNPNGSDYLWYISDDVKEDMSEELRSRLDEYDKKYKYYKDEYSVQLSSGLIEQYNTLVDKYKNGNSDLQKIKQPIVGYANLMKAYYQTINIGVYLQSGLLPSVKLSTVTAITEGRKLTVDSLSPVSVSSIKNISLSTADSAVLSVAKCIVNSNFRVKISSSSISGQTWKGKLIVTNYSDEEDTYTTNTLSIKIDDNLENYVQQKIQKVLSQNNDDVSDTAGIFKKNYNDFKNELKKYNLDSLKYILDMGQSCIDILVEQGIADKKTWANKNPNLYKELYVPYLNKLRAIEEEIKIREEEVYLILGEYDSDNNIKNEGLQSLIIKERNNIQNELNFQQFLGDDLWNEFCIFRRESTYENQNYISDGLNNADLFSNALEFIEKAEKEIYKSAVLQHSISSTLYNLLVIRKFKPLVDNFKVGNWLRILVDDNVYKLRLIDYEINYDDLKQLSVTFSDVLEEADGYSDQISVLEKASSMATSYDSVQRQAGKGAKGNAELNDWVNRGLSLTKMKIIDDADQQNVVYDSHGILCREFLPIINAYSDKQLKIINKGLYLTDDNWETSRAGIGNFNYYNPETGNIEEGYGVIADTIVGNLVLSEKVGVYSQDGAITLDNNGLTVTSNVSVASDGSYNNDNRTIMSLRRKIIDADGNELIEPIMDIDPNGNLVLTGTVLFRSSSSDTSSLESVYNDKLNELSTSIDNMKQDVLDETNSAINDYQSGLSKYIRYDENGLVIGDESSTVNTIVGNDGISFVSDGQTVASITNNQLQIPDAVIENTLSLGNYYFNPREDGSVSLIWRTNS